MTRSGRLAARQKMYEDIANGNGPLDRVERFCRERGIVNYCDFIDTVMNEDTELAEWALKSGRGQGARCRGINARISKVRQELRKGAGN